MKVNSSVFGGTSQARAVATATSSVIPAAIDNGADAFRDALPVASHNSAGMQALDHVIESAERTGQRYQKSIELGIRDGSSPIADRIMLGAQEATGATKIAEGMAKYDASQDRNLTDGEAGLKLLEGGVQMGATAVTLAAPVLPAGGGMVNLADDVIDVAGGTATSSKLPNGQFRSVAFETKLERGSYPGVTRGRHNQEANANLLRSMESDPSLASSMNSLGIEMHRTKTGKLPHMPPAGWTWHHDVTPGTMQLIPRTQHTPGSIFWDGMHPGGRRGYAMWGTCR